MWTPETTVQVEQRAEQKLPCKYLCSLARFRQRDRYLPTCSIILAPENKQTLFHCLKPARWSHSELIREWQVQQIRKFYDFQMEQCGKQDVEMDLRRNELEFFELCVRRMDVII